MHSNSSDSLSNHSSKAVANNLAHLPAFSLVESLCRDIQKNNIVIGAPPGAGKSTILPLALLSSELKGKVLLMQPRRVVVRNLAGFLAKQLGEPVGQTIGYRIRGETKVSQQTRIELITEGVLTRMIQQDPELQGVAVIMFDEFHERSIHSDFGLALALEVQAGLREDLRLVVMSATLQLEPLNQLLEEHSPITVSHLSTEGRAYPVEVFYGKDTLAKDIVSNTVLAIKNAVSRHHGDILAFLPSRGVINAVERDIDIMSRHDDAVVLPLYGALSKAAQERAIFPDEYGRRKIILATNIAETSLTIEGVTVVIDSLWENSAQYHPSSDMTQLIMQRISQASAVQRTGRAGRVSEGVCYRLCSKESFERLAKHSAAQIEKEDITGLLLDTYAWGSRPSELALLTAPSATQESVALKKLQRLGCVDQNGAITNYGKSIAELPCQPHLANLLLTCKRGGRAFGEASISQAMQNAMRQAAPFIVALSESTELGQRNQGQNSPLVGDTLRGLSAKDRAQLLKLASRFERFVGLEKNGLSLSMLDDDAIGLCIAIAFPLQVAYLRTGSTQDIKSLQQKRHKQGPHSNTVSADYKLASGKGATIDSLTAASPYQWLAVLHGQHIDNTIKIRLAQPVSNSYLPAVFPNAFNEKKQVRLNQATGDMEARTITGFYAIDLESKPVSKEERGKNKSYWQQSTVEAWLNYLEAIPLKEWPLSDSDWQWWRRVKLAAKHNLPLQQGFDSDATWPNSLNDLVQHARQWLSEQLANCTSLKALQRLSWKTALSNGLTWSQQHALEQMLPTSVTLPTQREGKLDYRENGDVVLSVKLTEMYSQSVPIVIAGGKVIVICELLSPAGRPLQTTSDLNTFWQGSYKEIQKEMKGRYPKHFWPDDPAIAKPTNKTKKRM